jgi:hypothetical protein
MDSDSIPPTSRRIAWASQSASWAECAVSMEVRHRSCPLEVAREQSSNCAGQHARDRRFRGPGHPRSDRDALALRVRTRGAVRADVFHVRRIHTVRRRPSGAGIRRCCTMFDGGNRADGHGGRSASVAIRDSGVSDRTAELRARVQRDSRTSQQRTADLDARHQRRSLYGDVRSRTHSACVDGPGSDCGSDLVVVGLDRC